jgi:glycosyltransferase involved in cell wall biosynthesis
VTLIGGGPELPRLEQYVLENHLADTVNFTQALSHPETLAQLKRADVFALASFAEGIPVALMEAMSFGLPCVSTYIAGIPELIRSGIDGLLVPPANAVALANALEIVIGDPVLRRSLGASARQRIINQYNLPLNQELLAHTFKQKTESHEPSGETGR